MNTELKNALGQVYYTAEYDEVNQWLYSNWTGYVTTAEVKQACETVLETIVKRKVTRLLNDNSALEGSWDEANEWIAQSWMPRALAGGLKRFAHVASPDVFGALSAEAMSTRVPEVGFELRIFGNRSQAQNWLSQPVATLV